MAKKENNKKNHSIDLPVMSSNGNANPKSHWKSMEEYYNPDSKDLESKKRNEFSDGINDFDLNKKSPLSRRKFLGLMAASSAFAAAACTDYRDKGEIIAYNDKPEEVLPGVPNYFASTLMLDGKGWGVLVKTREGRPIKIDGNPEHPLNRGKIDSIGQARILDLYDPGRIQGPRKNNNGNFVEGKWEDIDNEIIEKLKSAASEGKEIAIITGKVISPSQKQLLEDFTTKYPTTKVYSYSLFNEHNRNNAWKKSYNTNKDFPLVDLTKANILLSIDSDFLATDGDTTENTRNFVQNRNVDDIDNFSRFYAFEGSMTLTGSNADYRFRLTPENYGDLIVALANHFASKSGKPTISGFKSLDELTKENGWVKKRIEKLVHDLEHNTGKSFVIAGKQLPESVHIAANYLNELLGASNLYRKDAAEANVHKLSSNKDILNLISDMNSGKVAVAINMDTNPAYHFGTKFKDAFSKVPTKISLTEFDSETTVLSDYSIGINHDVESWGDAKVRTGLLSTQQPVIEPLYNTRQKESILLNWHNENEEYSYDIYHKYMMNNWKNNIYPTLGKGLAFKEFWYTLLHDGVVQFNENTVSERLFNQASLSEVKPIKKNGYSVILQESYFVGDGRYVSNGFLQESPHPITKITWDNCAMVSPDTAEELGVKMSDMIKVSVNGGSVDLPVVVQPGMADKVIATDLGYGRENAGLIGSKTGFNVIPLMSMTSEISNWIYSGAKVEKTGETYDLVSVQEHHPLDDEFLRTDDGQTFERARGIIQEATVSEYKNNPEVLNAHKHEVFSITENHKYTGLKWAMSIDMNKCIGCNACNIACYVENNIPVVGKEEVGVGREMGWIRIDRYYAGDPNDPVVSNQPMLCQHCDNAPCENVCPVVATTHSPEGINQMVYNRCVGTRYCANNCPYKVRRFNFYDFRDHLADGYYKSESMKQGMNPEVTIRARGVMEKCTFCIQRISQRKQDAKREGRPFQGSDVTTACQDACPANAIVFGDSNDENSEIARMRDHNLGYYVLESLNVKPNVTYIAKLRNIESEGVAHSEHH